MPGGEAQDSSGRTLAFPDVLLKDLNTQVAEQGNSRLSLICTPVAYMKQTTFMAHVKYFLSRTNENLLDKFVKKY